LGLLLMSDGGNLDAEFSSSEDGSWWKRPWLAVTYLVPCNSVPRTIGIAQSAAAPVRVSAGTYDITYTVTLQNLSTVPLANVQVSNDVAATYSSFTIQGLPTASSPLTINAAFTGTGANKNLLGGADSLPTGSATYTITFTARVTGITSPAGPFGNSATATAAATPGGTPIATDVSNSGGVNEIDPSSSAPTYVRFLVLAQDNEISGAAATTNYGASTSLNLYEGGSGHRVLGKASLSALPTTTAIQTATLRWYVSGITSRSGSPMTLKAYTLTQPWTEGTRTGSGTADGATWNRRDASNNWTTAGGTYGATPTATVTVPASFNTGYVDIDVTAAAQQWVANAATNNGVIVQNLATDRMLLNGDEAASNLPELVLTY
jgi:hypothetical protein